MGKPRGQGRYEALRLAVAGLRTVQLSLLLAGVLLAWCPGAWALDPALDVSQYAHTAWRIRDGFTKGEILAIAQTPDGYLWLGTEFGLLRFDGARAVPWQPPPGQQLPSTHITCLMVSRDGTLWIGTAKGLASYRNGQLTRHSDITGRAIHSLLEDREGTIWAGEWEKPQGRLCAIRNGVAGCYGADGSLGWGALSLYEDSKGSLWVGSDGGFWHWKPGRPKFYSLGTITTAVPSFAEDNDGALLIAAQGMGIRLFVDGKIEEHPYNLPNFMRGLAVYRLLRDRDGALWIGIYGGGLVHAHQGRTDVFTRSEGLSANTMEAVFQDREGNIWVNTTEGLDRFRNLAVATWSAQQGLPFAPGGGVLAASDGSVWTGSARGLGRLKQTQVTVYRQRHEPGSPLDPEANREIINPELPQSFFALLQDESGRIWVSSWGGGLGYLQDQRYHPIKPVGTKSIIGMAEGPGGDLWVNGQQDGLFRLHEGKIIENVSWQALARKDKDYGERLAVDLSRGGVWVGYRSGGVTFFSDGQVRAAQSASDGLGEGVVNDLRFGPRGTLWAATEGGLSRIKDGHVTTLTSKNGLPCDEVHWTMEDDDNFVWLYMACGLVRIAQSDLDAWASDRKQGVDAMVLDASDGVRTAASPTGYSPQVSKAPDGRIWFVTLDGISVLDPRHLPFNKVPPPVRVEQITADGKVYDVASAPSGRLRLPPVVRDLAIDYTALSLVVPEKVHFRYKLEGQDTDWREVVNNRQVQYTNLRPRNYRFRVMACNNSGVWNEAGGFLDFSVAPAYYQTSWFRLSCVAAFLALLWALYQLRLRQVAREFNAGLEARVNERTRIARELHDSLLQGVQGLMFRLQAVRDMLPGRAPAEAIEALDIALERGDKAIAEGRDTVSDLREPIMGDSDIAQALTALGEELALQSGNGLVPCVRVLLEGKRRELNPILRDEIYRIAREALRNAFRHARAQKIEAEITYSDSEFLLHVRDDGGGIDPEVANQGARAGHWGLPGMRERAKSFGGKLEVWSEHGAGTEIELSVPGAIAYGKSEPHRRFWLWRKKIGESDGQQS